MVKWGEGGGERSCVVVVVAMMQSCVSLIQPLFLLFFCVCEQVPAGAGSAAPSAGAAGATPSRPRVNGEMLGSFVGAEVSLVGRVEQVDGTNATLQAAVRWPCMFVCGCMSSLLCPHPLHLAVTHILTLTQDGAKVVVHLQKTTTLSRCAAAFVLLEGLACRGCG